MSRKVRIRSPGAIYYVMNRGDQREDIFEDDMDREKFLSTFTEACLKTDWQVHAYCLMRNHFHFVIEPTCCAVSQSLRSLQMLNRAYCLYVNSED